MMSCDQFRVLIRFKERVLGWPKQMRSQDNDQDKSCHFPSSVRSCEYTACETVYSGSSHSRMSRYYNGKLSSKLRSRGSDPRYSSKISHTLILHSKLNDESSLTKIRAILKLHPHTIRCLNSLGQTALHVAAARAVAPDILWFLFETHPDQCSVRDAKGRYPIHYLAMRCRDIIDNFEPSEANVSSQEWLMDLTKAMYRAYPVAITLEDFRRQNPIECALLNDAPYQVFKLLQRCSATYWKGGENKKIQTNDSAKPKTHVTREKVKITKQLCPPKVLRQQIRTTKEFSFNSDTTRICVLKHDALKQVNNKPLMRRGGLKQENNMPLTKRGVLKQENTKPHVASKEREVPRKILAARGA